jgi:CRP-like cAMP-binding protein
LIFKEGDPCDHIAIVKQGTFELLKKIPHIIKDEYDLNQMIGSLKIKRDPEHV